MNKFLNLDQTQYSCWGQFSTVSLTNSNLFLIHNSFQIFSPQAEPAPELAPPAPEPSAPPPPASGGAEEEEVDKLEVDKVDEPLTFSPMAEEASEAGAIPMAANAIRQEAEMVHSEAIS